MCSYASSSAVYGNDKQEQYLSAMHQHTSVAAGVQCSYPAPMSSDASLRMVPRTWTELAWHAFSLAAATTWN